MFELWSKTNKNASELLTPNLRLRDWEDLSAEEKIKI